MFQLAESKTLRRPREVDLDNVNNNPGPVTSEQQRPQIKQKKARAKKKSSATIQAPPTKKAKPTQGETIDEDHDDSGIQSTFAESIYEDFDTYW